MAIHIGLYIIFVRDATVVIVNSLLLHYSHCLMFDTKIMRFIASTGHTP